MKVKLDLLGRSRIEADDFSDVPEAWEKAAAEVFSEVVGAKTAACQFWFVSRLRHRSEIEEWMARTYPCTLHISRKFEAKGPEEMQVIANSSRETRAF